MSYLLLTINDFENNIYLTVLLRWWCWEVVFNAFGDNYHNIIENCPRFFHELTSNPGP